MNIVKQMLEFLPEQFYNAIQRLNQTYLYEIRMRANRPTMLRFAGKYVYLTDYGISERREEALIATYSDIEETVLAASKYSVYSVEEQLKQGFLTAEAGERLGIAGRFVFVDGKPLTVRDYSSLCIRVPHDVVGCSDALYKRCLSSGMKNLLIVSPPGQGKTTILRDLSRNICEKLGYNVLICDERGEIASGKIGDTADVFAFADKKSALEIGVRVMRPDVIITDELSLADLPSVERAKNCGVRLIASFHAEKYEEIPAALQEAFDVIAVLNKEEIGKIDKVY